jgi:hypothetical protein
LWITCCMTCLLCSRFHIWCAGATFHMLSNNARYCSANASPGVSRAALAKAAAHNVSQAVKVTHQWHSPHHWHLQSSATQHRAAA